ncbi:YrbL family protein [Flexibacterium corallicola]|uniref:YrbL family protein n=1 Tax=Flexibacterium corallicola TaxID=3037259 RepID=UPI00286F49F1|nr:YrbL family protein [Pseudovibrio sp. M1P-2-3]
MLQLREEDHFASGGIRDIYYHPHNKELCIKVDKNTSGPRERLNHGQFGTSAELDYYSFLEQKRGHLNFHAIAQFYDSVETSRGRGAVFQLVKDETSQHPSKTLFHEMSKEHDVSEQKKHSVALREFKKRLLKDRVLCRDLKPINICVQKLKDGTYRYVLVDGIGHKSYRKYGSLRTYIKMLRHLHRREMRSYRVLKTACSTNGVWAEHMKGRAARQTDAPRNGKMSGLNPLRLFKSLRT